MKEGETKVRVTWGNTANNRTTKQQTERQTVTRDSRRISGVYRYAKLEPNKKGQTKEEKEEDTIEEEGKETQEKGEEKEEEEEKGVYRRREERRIMPYLWRKRICKFS